MNNINRLLAQIYRHGLWRAACVVLAILLIPSAALAAQSLTGTFKGKVIGQYVSFSNTNNKIVTDWAGVLSLQLDQATPGDGLGPLVPVFCIEVNVLVRTGDRYKSDGSVTALPNGCQIRYLLDRYPASTATTPEEAAARQLAIWHFSDDIDLTTVQEPAIKARAIALADEAKLAVALGGCPSAQTSVTSLTLNPPNASVVAGQVVNYTISANPPGAAQSVDISISGSATLQNGQQQATLPLIQGVATFSVVNPVVGSSTITARLPYALDAGTVFSPINSSHATQRLVMADRVSLSASATVQAAWAPATDTPTAGLPTAAPPTTIPPTATPSTDTPPTATPSGDTSSTATPSDSVPSTATPSGDTSSTATPQATATPTAAVPTQSTPVNAPLPSTTATPTHKPSGGPKPPGGPKPSPTPESTPTGDSSSPPSGGAGPNSSGTPTSSGGSPDLPGGNAGPGGAGTGSTGGAGMDTAGGTQTGSAGTNGQGGVNRSDVPRPSQLPNTGDASSATAVALAIAVLLLACGIWLRKQAVRS